MARNEQFGILATNSFRTLTGGILYYDYKIFLNLNEIKNYILFIRKKKDININQLFLIEQSFG
jgi:hypothetical protein